MLAVIGAAGVVGRRVVRELAGDGPVVALDRRPLGELPAGVRAHRADLTTDGLDGALGGVDTVVHVAVPRDPAVSGARTERNVVDGTRRLLDAAGRAEVRHVVAVTSAIVYGAWPTNPVPLTEEHPVRPNPGCALAVHLAQAESVLADWAEAHEGVTVGVLRPAAVVAEEPGWLAGQLGAVVAAAEEGPPTQFLHREDLVSAVVLAARRHLDGPVNVAPDGWIDPEGVRALTGSQAGRRTSERIVRTVASLGVDVPGADTRTGIRPYLEHPWVVANDRLRALGWEPGWTNEEALVAAHRVPWWEGLSPKHRQELALGVAGVAIAASAAGVVLAARRLSARRRGAGARRG